MVFIKVEPSGISMYSVHLIYDLEKPDGEDQRVRDYLVEHELEPKHQGQGEYEGRQSDVMFFGGCYLGRHLDRIGQIQRSAVEVELLTAEIESLLSAASEEMLLPPLLSQMLSKEKRQDTIAGLVEEFHQESSFETTENGDLKAVLDGEMVRAAARRRMAVS